MNEQTQLLEGSRRLQVPLAAGDAQRLLQLLDELAHWNKAYNLTAIHKRKEMITHHLLDSLAVHSYLRGTAVADVGTGAGFPGLPLAVVNPGKRFTLIDSNSKKIRFVSHAVRTLGLSNVTAAHARVEALTGGRHFDTVVARAFAPLPQLLTQVAPLCGPHTQVLAMKGKDAEAQTRHLPRHWRVLAIHPVEVPGLHAARHIVVCALRVDRSS